MYFVYGVHKRVRFVNRNVMHIFFQIFCFTIFFVDDVVFGTPRTYLLFFRVLEQRGAQHLSCYDSRKIDFFLFTSFDIQSEIVLDLFLDENRKEEKNLAHTSVL
jgi:hypothetical protein